MRGNPLQRVVLSDAVRERVAYSMGRCVYPAASAETKKRSIQSTTPSTKDRQRCRRNPANNWETRSSDSCKSNAYHRTAGETVVPALRGDETEAEAEEWMRCFFSFAMQERLSEDQALLVALEHLELESAGVRAAGLGIASMQEFLEKFCRHCELSTGDGCGTGDFANRSLSGTSTCMWGLFGPGKGRQVTSRLRKLVPHIVKRLGQIQWSSCVRFSHRELAFATNVFSKAHILGESEIGCIYHGLLANKRPVAVRKLRKPACCMETTIQQLQREVVALSMISHTNLLRLLGSCLESDEPLLVYELEPRGSLMTHLQEGCDDPLDWDTRFMIALDAADGLAHLHHACNPPLLHKNLKSSNILLDKHLRPKITDFGISRSMFKKDFCPSPGTICGYTDPSYVQTYRFTEKSDVYSFGVVLMELVTGQKAVDFTRPEGMVTLAAMALAQRRGGFATVGDLFDSVLQKLGQIDLDTMHDVVLLALKCLATDGETRPTMQQVADQLRMIQDREVIRRKRRRNANYMI